MAVTADQIDAIAAKFTDLADAILAAVPHSHQVDIIEMWLKGAESMVLIMLRQQLAQQGAPHA
jgi:hypothetical protein